MGRGRESVLSQGLAPSCLFLQRGQSQENKTPQGRLGDRLLWGHQGSQEATGRVGGAWGEPPGVLLGGIAGWGGVTGWGARVRSRAARVALGRDLGQGGGRGVSSVPTRTP